MSQPQNSPSRLLLCSRQQDSVLALQGAVLRDNGRFMVAASASADVQEHIENAEFDILVLNHTLSFSERKMLARKAKARNPATGVLVLHHSGSLGNPYVDLAVDSRTGAKAMLAALQRVEAMFHARTHHQAEFQGEYFVVADANRNYTFVTDHVCRLLGYDRAMLLDLRIDEVVMGATPVTDPLFREFVVEGKQTGTIDLRHRSGKRVVVKYWASVEPDGCMTARWEPLQETSDD